MLLHKLVNERFATPDGTTITSLKIIGIYVFKINVGSGYESKTLYLDKKRLTCVIDPQTMKSIKNYKDTINRKVNTEYNAEIDSYSYI